jgi:hypothetical protein
VSSGGRAIRVVEKVFSEVDRFGSLLIGKTESCDGQGLQHFPAFVEFHLKIRKLSGHTW